MTPVFLDTVGLVAIWNRSDQWHAVAMAAFTSLLQRQVPLVTTAFILFECGNEAARRPYRGQVVALRQRLLTRGSLIEPTPAEVDQAWAEYGAGAVGTAGIIDHVSFVVMRRLGITDAFTNDRHFQAAGFSTLF
jgi:predicted nucleic acid-binding protein